MKVEATRNVFKKSGLPTYTFVEHERQHEIQESMLTAGRGIVIEGPSGVGKTSCIKKAIENSAHDYSILSAKKPDHLELIKGIIPGRNFGKVVVDDFHDLTDDIKSVLSQTMKTVADDEEETNRLVIIGINKAGAPLISFSRDVATRVDFYKITRVSDDKIAELIGNGEDILNISFLAKRDIITDSHGCFNIAQMICNKLCLINKVLQTDVTSSGKLIGDNLHNIKEEMLEPFERLYKNIAKRFAIGPSFSPEGRAPYLHILYWLSKSEGWSINLQEISDERPAYRTSLNNVMRGKLQSFMESSKDFQEILYYDANTQVVSVEDPKFMYFLKNIPWNSFTKEIGYTMHFDSNYDIALSFAGQDRDIAFAIFNALEARGISVFYDFNEQSRISGEDVEKYLAPIYRSEAKYVVPILGKAYPTRLWTKFETEQFKSRFIENAVIPIRTNETDEMMIPGMQKVGGLFFDKTKDLDSQILTITDDLVAKIRYYRRFQVTRWT